MVFGGDLLLGGRDDGVTWSSNVGFELFFHCFIYQFYPYLSCRTRPNPLSSSGEKLSNVGHPRAIYGKSRWIITETPSNPIRSPWNPVQSPWIRFLNLGFRSPIVPSSSWGGQAAKGCKSGVAWKYAQTRTSLVHPSSEFPWNAAWLVRADEASTKQNLILRWAVQQLVSSPHPTGLSQNWGRAQKSNFYPLSLLLKPSPTL